MFIGKWCVIVAMIFSTIAAAKASDVEERRPHWSDVAAMKTYRDALFSHYSICSNEALDRMISPGEVKICSDLYLALKLSFLNGVTIERYRGMSPVTKRVAQQKGYAAFRAWRHRHIASMQ